MPDATKPPSSLSEISHLFLSSLRDKSSGPKRTPPPTSRPSVSVDLTPEEFDQVKQVDAPVLAVPVTAVLAAHLEDAGVGVGAYAQHLAAHNQRVGLIEIDSNELRLSCVAGGASESAADEAATYLEPRHLAEAMEELNADVDRWLVVVKNPRSSESHHLLRQIPHWLLISTCESEGVIAAYRSLKALSPLARPRLTVALLDATDAKQAERVCQKISGVCEQFLHWPIERGPSLRSAVPAHIHTIMHYQPHHQSSTPAPHWQTIERFLSRAAAPEAEISPEEHQEIAAPGPVNVRAGNTGSASAPFRGTPGEGRGEGNAQIRNSKPEIRNDPHLGPPPEYQGRERFNPASADAVSIALSQSTSSGGAVPILSLSTSEPTSILDAVLQHHADLIACPVPIPMCETARLTVGRDRSLLLIAVAGKGLADLRSIAYAYRWLTENRQLVAMAVPQLAINTAAAPKLRLLIDHADRDAQTLSPILQNPLVEIQPFRKLDWSGRLGLMLEAA